MNGEMRREGYKELAVAIVEQAILDYCKALKDKDTRAKTDRYALERFFRGQYCAFLCDLDGEKIIELCREKVSKEVERKAKRKRGVA